MKQFSVHTVRMSASPGAIPEDDVPLRVMAMKKREDGESFDVFSHPTLVLRPPDPF